MNLPLSRHQAPIKISHYDVIEPLGHGGMGVVYLAKDTRLERFVAIKCLRPDLIEDHFITRFKREALLLAQLNHPHIVQIYDYIETPEQLALVMELVEGDHLKHYLKEHIVTVSQRLNWLAQITEGLAFAHEAGIIHRDLKLENILISKHLKAKISDLGIAKSHEINSTLTDHITGSYCAMSPEQASGQIVSFKSDLFSLGILAYQLLSGSHPFGNADNKLQMMQRIITEPFIPLRQHNPDLAPELIELIEQLLDKNPDNRPDNTRWVATQFERMRHQIGNDSSQTDDTFALTTDLQAPHSAHSQTHATERTNAAFSRTHSIFNYLKHKSTYGFIGLIAILAVGLFSLSVIKNEQVSSTFHNSATDTTDSSLTGMKEFSISENLNKGFAALKHSDLQNQLTIAENHFQSVLKYSPNNAAAVAGLSLVFCYRYESSFEDPIWLQKADAGAQQAMALDPQLAFSQIALGRVLNLKAEREKALKAYEKALTLAPSNIFAWRGKAMVLRLMQRYDEAINFVEKGITQFPRDGRIAVDLGMIYIDQRNYLKAEEAFRLSIQRQPDSVEAYAGLNMALLFQGRDNEAIQTLQQGLHIQPSEHLYGNLGTVLFSKGDYVGAASSFEAAVSPTKGNPMSHLAWANLGDALLWIPGRETEAQKAYQKARELLAPLIKRRINDPTLISRMGLYSARLGDRTQAEVLLPQAIQLSPKNPTIQFRVGLAYELLSNRELAVSALTRAVELGYPLKLIQAEPDLIQLRRESGKF